MAYIGFEQVVADATVKTVANLTVPANTTHVELQASGQHVSYNMNNDSDPTQTVGMFLLVTKPPKTFLIEDVKTIRFTRAAGSNGALNLHYFAGRNI